MPEPNLDEKEIVQVEQYYNELRKQVELIRRLLSQQQPQREPLLDLLSHLIKEARSAQALLSKKE